MDFERFEDIPDTSYEVVYADPPWWYYGDPNKMAAAGKHYDLMTDEQLRALPVRKKCKKSAVCFLWSTGPRLDSAMDLIRAWGFAYRGVGFVWVKTRKDGHVIGAQGVRPSIVKPTTEFVLTGTLGEFQGPLPEGVEVEFVLAGSTKPLGRPLPLESESVKQVVFAPRGAHSEKPPEVRSRIELLYGNRPRLELFARGFEVPGWDRFGNELETSTAGLMGGGM